MTRDETRLRQTMRNLTAQGWHDEAILVDAAAQVIGGDEASKLQAQRVFDRHFKVMGGG